MVYIVKCQWVVYIINWQWVLYKKQLKERCYLHSVQHSYENRSCKQEIKYFSSVNLWFTGVNHQFTVDYSGLQWITVVNKGKHFWKKGCYLHSVQHSYENRSCKPEIKYFSSVNCQFTGVNHQITLVNHQFTGVNRRITHRQKTCKSWWSLGLGPSKVFHTKDQSGYFCWVQHKSYVHGSFVVLNGYPQKLKDLITWPNGVTLLEFSSPFCVRLRRQHVSLFASKATIAVPIDDWSVKIQSVKCLRPVIYQFFTELTLWHHL